MISLCRCMSGPFQSIISWLSGWGGRFLGFYGLLYGSHGVPGSPFKVRTQCCFLGLGEHGDWWWGGLCSLNPNVPEHKRPFVKSAEAWLPGPCWLLGCMPNSLISASPWLKLALSPELLAASCISLLCPSGHWPSLFCVAADTLAFWGTTQYRHALCE